MSYQPFDVTTKVLVEFEPAAWLTFLGIAGRIVKVVDADLSTVSAAGDKLILIAAGDDENPTSGLHFEFQSHRFQRLPQRTHMHNAIAEMRVELPIESVVLALRPEADGPELTGRLENLAGGSRYIFEYRVVRVWQLEVSRLLTGPLGLVPLAPLANISAAELPAVIAAMNQRLTAEAPPDRLDELWVASYIMMGLKYPHAVFRQVTHGVLSMKDSVTYQKIFGDGEAKGKREGKTEGKVDEARALLVKLGTRRLGRMPRGMKAKLESITDVRRLEDLVLRAAEISSWAELLAETNAQ